MRLLQCYIPKIDCTLSVVLTVSVVENFLCQVLSTVSELPQLLPPPALLLDIDGLREAEALLMLLGLYCFDLLQKLRC